MWKFWSFFLLVSALYLISCKENKEAKTNMTGTEDNASENLGNADDWLTEDSSYPISDSMSPSKGKPNLKDNEKTHAIVSRLNEKSLEAKGTQLSARDKAQPNEVIITQNENGQEISRPVLPEGEEINLNKKNEFKTKPDHHLWNDLLKRHVSSSGIVNYKGFKLDTNLLEDYLKSLEGPFDFKTWSTSEKLAYWINVYNANTVKLIVVNYPIKSIRELHNGKPWSQSFVYANDTYYTLDDIQKKILMSQFGDPRIHFAINCAAKSCPPLVNQAYTKANVNNLLESQARSFINSSFNNIDAKKATLSKIFEWYASDFDDVISFINKYSTKKIDGKTKINYNDYDWSLNGQ